MSARTRRSALLAFLVCTPAAFVFAGEDESVRLSPDEVRALAREALQSGRPDLARELAMGLLKADAEDPFAYAVLSNAHNQLGNPGLARSAARLTYKHSDGRENKLAAARAAGQLAFEQKRMNTAQIWLRRAAVHAESDAENQAVKRDYSAVRSRNPFALSFRASLTPSSNVNNGAESDEVRVNGVLQNVTLGASSQALSGWVGTVDTQASYRLRHTETSRTTAALRLYSRQVSLSSDAKATAPAVTNSDFAVTYTDVSIDHAFALGTKGNSAAVQSAIGAVWVAGDHAYSFARLGVRRAIRLQNSNRLNLSLSHEWRDSEFGSSRDARHIRFGAHFAHKLSRGDTLSLSFNTTGVSSDFNNGSYQDTSLRLGYAFGKQIGPAVIETGLSLGQVDYSTYLFATGAVPGGRKDQSIHADLNMIFHDYDYAGFAPSLHIKAGKTSSNISRFTTSEVSVGFGIQSKF